MSTFLLAHGAWHGGWYYQRVAQSLRSNGHIVFTPTYTGLGERSHLFDPSINLDTHVQDIINVIKWEDLDDFVLVGHSYGGMVVTGVADLVPEKIHTLVYLDAFVPENDQCLFDFQPDELRAQKLQEAAAQNGGLTPIPAESFHVNPGDVDWVNSKTVLQPIHTMDQPVRLTGGLERLRRKRVFILAAKYPEGPFKPFYEKLHKDPNWETYKIESGHHIMLDKPHELELMPFRRKGPL